ncbi:hypothetical protein GCM10022263_15500 [Nocardioides daeguensis]|uniref:DUF3558 domain-containing protein n=1 Tax=Nocardioides daeguensis TaxID=908359 RepID=A0ABP6V7L4_9ACTN
MLGGVLVAVVVLVAVALGAYLLAGGGDAPSAQQPTRTATGSPTGSPAGSPAVPGAGPTTPYTPSDDTDDDIHNDVEVADFPGDWDFRLGDIEHHATLLRTVDHPSCAPVEAGSVLTDQRCTYVAQWVFRALGGRVRLTHLFLVFDTERHARAAQGDLADQDLDLPDGSLVASPAQGTWSSSVYGNIVSVTVGTSRVPVAEQELESLVSSMNSDYESALRFRF